jgi:hypothetical protein
MIRKLLNTAALAAPAFAMLALAQPASAKDAAGGVAATASAAEARSTAAAQTAPKKYCADITPDTGTRVSRRVCRTKAEWSEEGVELGAKK